MKKEYDFLGESGYRPEIPGPLMQEGDEYQTRWQTNYWSPVRGAAIGQPVHFCVHGTRVRRPIAHTSMVNKIFSKIDKFIHRRTRSE